MGGAAGLVARGFFGVAVLLFAGCTMRPSLLGVESTRVADEQIVMVLLRPDDAERMKRRQIHFAVVVVDCAETRAGYPAEPEIVGQPASGGVVRVVGRVPAAVYDRYERPCVFLRGGSYGMARVETAPLPVESKSAAPEA